jgi:CHAT domain-containing protein
MNSQIFQALGQSVAYEDYRGNFDRARQISQQWLAQARQMGDASALAEALIWRAIVHIMQGELLAAMMCTAEVGCVAPQDANLCLRALSYELLTTYERFNAYPDGCGAGATEISARWRGAADLQPVDARWHDLLRQATDPQAQNEAWLIYAFLCNLKPGRFILESSRYAPSTVSREQMLQTVLNTPIQVQQSAQASSLPGLAAYADWCAANLCHRAGQEETAQQFLERAQLTYQQANDPLGMATCLMERADWQCAPFSTPVAWNLALQDSSSEGSHLSIQLESDEFSLPSTTAVDGARQWYAEAERLFQQGDAPRGLSALQLRHGYLAMLEDRYAMAAQCAEQASASFRQCGDYRGSSLAQTHLIMSRIGAGQWTATPTLAREIGESGAQYLYFQAARAAMKQGDYARSFDYAERGKARGLLDLMAGSAVIVRAPETESVAMRSWRQLNAQLTLRRGLLAQERGKPEPNAPSIAQFTRQIAADEEQLHQIEAELALSNPNFQKAVSVEATTLSLDEVAAALPAGAAMLEYFFLAGDLLVWAITPEGLKRAVGVSLDTDALAREIRAFHHACETRAHTESLGTKLAETLLTPFTDVIRASSRLIIVPYGAAHTLPFQALPFDGDPLGAARPVSYLPSASVLQFLRLDGAHTVPERILAVGNPTLNLPAAAAEAAFVASLFGQPALLGEAATEQAVLERIPDCPVLHFATHGRLSEVAPLSSSIMLADGEELTVYELMGLHLKADLVVLSACNTGQGETTGGDDVLGLTRGLLGAGARAAVVSLWQVDDVSTSLFMGELYRRLRAHDTPAEALQAAQNYLRRLNPAEIADALDELKRSVEGVGTQGIAPNVVTQARGTRLGRPVGTAPASADYRHPYYWAPFILVG